MKITKVETFQIETPRYYGPVSSHVIVKVHVAAVEATRRSRFLP